MSDLGGRQVEWGAEGGQDLLCSRGAVSQESGCLGWEWTREEDKATQSRSGFETNIDGRIIFASAAVFL